MNYKQAGVDIDKANAFVSYIKKHLEDVGLFGGIYDMTLENYRNPVLVSSVDGVGTKLEVLSKLGKFEIAGVDAVAMNANDIYTLKAKPLFFMDYLAFSKLDLEKAKLIFKGMLEACNRIGCKLVGGETAELNTLFAHEGSFDVVGFMVGIVEKDELPRKEDLEEGDIVVGIPSNGLHANGFSLVRKILHENGIGYEELSKELSEPTRIYSEVLRIKHLFKIGAHITGGGLYDNLKRILPENLDAVLEINYEVPEIFRKLVKLGNVELEEAFRVWNMGIGFCLILEENDLKYLELEHVVLGKLFKGSGKVILNIHESSIS